MSLDKENFEGANAEYWKRHNEKVRAGRWEGQDLDKKIRKTAEAWDSVVDAHFLGGLFK